jgi:diguanylate cyclase (GGDEF)-like protein
LPVLNKRNVGVEVVPMLSEMPAVAKAVAGAEERTEVFLGGLEGRCYEIETWPLYSATGNSASRRVGRAVILADVTAQVRLREELRSRAETDPLTGAANRRRFHQALEIECLRFARNRLPLSVLMIDLDFFKDVNDRYGHPVGDTVLRTVAQLLLLSLRKTDLLARYGGEEFSVLLPDTPLSGAMVIAERVRHAIDQKPIVADGCPLQVSISVGVASHADEGEASPELLLKKADLALYRAKALGRNRVEAG